MWDDWLLELELDGHESLPVKSSVQKDEQLWRREVNQDQYQAVFQSETSNKQAYMLCFSLTLRWYIAQVW